MGKGLELFASNNVVQKIFKEALNNKKVLVNESTENYNCLLAASMFLDDNNNNTIFLIETNAYKASICYDKISKLIGYDNVMLYAIDEVIASELDAVSNEFKVERINTIKELLLKNKKVIVTHITAALKKILPSDVFLNNIIKIKKNSILDIKMLIKNLINIGYKKSPTTNIVGDFSVRGGVIDIYPLNYDNPIRLDLFDDEVENIKFFDLQTQRSKKTEVINEISIYPNVEIIYDDGEAIANKIIKSLNNVIDEQTEKDLFDIKEHNLSDKLNKYQNYIYQKTELITEYAENKVVLFSDVKALFDCYIITLTELTEYLSTKGSISRLNLSYYDDFYSIFSDGKQIYLQKDENDIKELLMYNVRLDAESYVVNHYKNDVREFLEDIKRSNNKTKMITVTSPETKKMLIESLGIDNIIKYDIEIVVDSNSISFAFTDVICVDESSIYKKMDLKYTKYRSTYQNTTKINSKDDIKPGDYIVHYDYGIGKYNGIKSIELNDIINDYLSITYANMDLFIPVEKINLLEKYQTEEGYLPKLTNIGNGEWEKKKGKVREKIENLARDLVLLQAVRESKKGYKYDRDEEIQKEFEEDFAYIETKDQLQTIDDIKKDMEEGKIIDRLVCGDVGYGKTEVAIRIAMKTVLNGKQVAYLAPTTILTRQHYNVFKERMEKYGCNVALINRLVSRSDIKKIYQGLKSGEIDVVIGTHALLNDKIEYKDLGLLIIDEEQRFGVVHKEKIKQYKNNINVLTLTATPIPRTLQMSLMGAKQMSLIETPPQNRYPIQTYVLEKNDTIIREAIYNELGRGGQVFYLHNRIEDLEIVRSRIEKQVPEARIITAHGRMNKVELENAIQEFVDKNYDVLICTTIIETGIDIPNSNTLIVDMSDRLGLAQMYQIRGRVGRSDRVSYAYFMYDSHTILTEEGEARLKAIKEFTNLGSGYKIAMRDLTIRGAGDFLGKEQSGYIDQIGFDLYIKMLDDCLNEVNNIKTENEQNAFLDEFQVSKHIDNDYASDDEIKIYIHKQINNIKSKEDKYNVINDIEDRFGKLNSEIKDYIQKQYIDAIARSMGIESIKVNDFKVNVIFNKEASKKINSKTIMKIVFELGEDYSIQYKNNKYIISINRFTNSKKWMYTLEYILFQLFPNKL